MLGGDAIQKNWSLLLYVMLVGASWC